MGARPASPRCWARLAGMPVGHSRTERPGPSGSGVTLACHSLRLGHSEPASVPPTATQPEVASGGSCPLEIPH